MSTFALLLGLSLSMFGTAHIISPERMTCPTSCIVPATRLFGSKIVGYVMTIYLLICYWAAYSYVFPDAEIFFTKWLLTKPLELVERLFGIHQFHERFMHKRPIFPSLSLSHLFQAIWWATSFALTLATRFWGMKNPKKFHGKDERDWGFGQLLAVFLILLPLLSGIEIFYGKKACLRENKPLTCPCRGT
jgi:hypothetical protein